MVQVNFVLKNRKPRSENNHNATDMQLIPLELVKSNRDSVRKAREAYLIERGQTLEPHEQDRWNFVSISVLCLGHLYYL